MSDGKKLTTDGEGHHAEEVHPEEEEEGQCDREELHLQGEKHI